MEARDFKTACALTMLLMLVIYAPDWLNRPPAKSAYDAPWVYPSQAPGS